MRTAELSNLSSRTSDSTAYIQDLVSIFDTNLGGKIVLMTSESLEEGFAVGESAEMEGLRPAIFVEIGCEVVVTIYSALTLLKMSRRLTVWSMWHIRLFVTVEMISTIFNIEGESNRPLDQHRSHALQLCCPNA